MAEFEPAFNFTMDHEDRRRTGKVTHDAGGHTRFGIAQKFHPDLADEFFAGPSEEALLKAKIIMREEYWDAMRLAGIESQQVASKLFDMGVNMGVHQAGVLAQRAVNSTMEAPDRVAEDGKIGSRTLTAINAIPEDRYLALLREFSEAYYRHVAAVNPEQAVNLDGWLTRAAA